MTVVSKGFFLSLCLVFPICGSANIQVGCLSALGSESVRLSAMLKKDVPGAMAMGMSPQMRWMNKFELVDPYLKTGRDGQPESVRYDLSRINYNILAAVHQASVDTLLKTTRGSRPFADSPSDYIARNTFALGHFVVRADSQRIGVATFYKSDVLSRQLLGVEASVQEVRRSVYLNFGIMRPSVRSEALEIMAHMIAFAIDELGAYQVILPVDANERPYFRGLARDLGFHFLKMSGDQLLMVRKAETDRRNQEQQRAPEMVELPPPQLANAAD